MKRITIDPVTRIEGHAKISIFLDDAGNVGDARFHVTEFRGFEAFCVGRPLWEMPSLTARTCGICPISHLLASSKAGDAILAVTIPPTALKLRRLMNLGQIIQSHALSFFHLSSPDLLLGFDSAPEKRNVFGLMEAEPELARRGIRLRKYGQEIIATLGGQKIHPAWAVPGGVREGLSEEGRKALLESLPEARETTFVALELFKKLLDAFPREVASFGNFPSLFLGLVTPDGLWEHHDGVIRLVDAAGSIIADKLEPATYLDFIGEASNASSYLKSPYYRPLVDETQPVTPDSAGLYRVGPLARLNICERIGTPLADKELTEFRSRAGRIAQSSFYYYYARLIEILAAIEAVEILLGDADITSKRVRAEAGINRERGVGVSEAPRGTLFHDYTVDEHGLIKKVNMIIATGHNNLAMNRTVKQIAQEFINGANIQEGMLNRVEAGIRAYDPCLSCSTHAIGQMPLNVKVFSCQGELVKELVRG
jgi:NAD-reducing hydrogenase large subunit